MTGTLREDLRTVVIISRTVFRRMRNCSDKFVAKIKTHVLFSITVSSFFPNIMPFTRDNVEKCGRVEQTTDDSIIGRMRIALTHIWQQKLLTHSLK